MAQLARCPHCYTELELPAEVAEGDRANTWVKCPACEDSFAVADAKPRIVKQAQLSVDPSKLAEEPKHESRKEVTEGGIPTSESTSPTSSSSALSDSLLDSFLKDDAATEKYSTPSMAPEVSTESESQPDEPHTGGEQSSPSSGLPSLGDLKSLEDLFRGGKEPVETSAAETKDTDTKDADTEYRSTESADFGSKETIDLEEPSPAADRRRPTLGELFAESDAPSASADSGSYDPVEETSAAESPSDEEIQRENKQTSSDFDEMTLHDFAAPTFDSHAPGTRGIDADDAVAATTEDAPSFDQLIGEPGLDDSADELDDSKSLRASMGFPAIDDPLEVQEEENELVGVAADENHDELSFAKVDTPRGVVAARKRKSSFSAVRTVFGIVFGGVVGLYAGYLVILWVKVADPLNAANLYPDVIKPAAMRTAAASDVGPQSSLAQGSDSSLDDLADVTEDESSDIDLASMEAPVTDDEPMPWDQPAEKIDASASDGDEVAIVDAPSYTAAQIQQFAAEAEQAIPALLAPGPPTTSKGTSYALLAQLADALTFGEGATDASWNSEARQLFPPLFAKPEAREQISLIGGYWLTHPTRKHGGIFFCGTPDAGRQAGSVAEYQFTLPGGQNLTVVTPQALPEGVSVAPTSVVVGSVIDNPADRIEGYTGTATQVIWSENVLPAGK